MDTGEHERGEHVVSKCLLVTRGSVTRYMADGESGATALHRGPGVSRKTTLEVCMTLYEIDPDRALHVDAAGRILSTKI